MLDHSNPDNPQKYIITADRGYESYDLLFQCELKKLGYVFRVKAPSSGKCIHNNVMKEQKDVYHYMNPYKTIPHFQKLLDGKHLHFLRFRAVKIKTGDDTFEYLITNLPYSFDINDIREIYANLILYNFGIFIANEAAKEKRCNKRNNNKYTYDIDIIRLMNQYIHAVKTEFRQFDYPLRGISAIHFHYR